MLLGWRLPPRTFLSGCIYVVQHGARVNDDARELYRRMTLNVLISKVDDHLRNHGFL